MFANMKIPKLAASAVLTFGLTAAASALDAVDVFHQAPPSGSVDFRQMGYTNEHGEFISVVGQRILGAWAEITFDPTRRRDVRQLTIQMVVPVEDAASQMLRVDGSQLIPVGAGRYRAVVTSNLYNGTVRDGRYSIETFGLNAKGERVPVNGTIDLASGFHFIVSRPD